MEILPIVVVYAALYKPVEIIFGGKIERNLYLKINLNIKLHNNQNDRIKIKETTYRNKIVSSY